jgi:hypothetical protein
MKIDIKHVEKSQGLVFKKTFHGVALTVQFSEEENAIINQRKLGRTILIERDVPADQNAEKHQNRGIVSKLATAALKGADANHFDLTIGKLQAGTDTYYLPTPLAAKEYEAVLRNRLPDLKAHIMGNAEIERKSDSFEL